MNEFIEIPDSPRDPISAVLNTLRLDSVEDGVFLGSSIIQRTPRIYGGQVFAQAVISAAATLHGETADRAIHSITAAFLRPGDVNTPVRFEVEDVLDGRSFSTRRILAYQHGDTIFSARASFQEHQAGVEHQTSQPPAPDPHELESSIDFFDQL
ncbi:MAG: thioesterase family protein, partial [Actinomycetaceae bacterium]|nr:thioesterase family protein [Actinomycetaceae bacterium]